MRKHPWTLFGVEKDGEPISKHRPKNSVDTGIAYRPPMVGLISEMEERDSARFSGYEWKQWRELDYQQRVDGVAYYRLTRIISITQEDAVSTETERRSRRSGRKK